MNAPKGIYPPGMIPMPRGINKTRYRAEGGSAYKKGGRVKGCGIAKRGVGRAMKKGRK